MDERFLAGDVVELKSGVRQWIELACDEHEGRVYFQDMPDSSTEAKRVALLQRPDPSRRLAMLHYTATDFLRPHTARVALAKQQLAELDANGQPRLRLRYGDEVAADDTPPADRMLKWFAAAHLKSPLREVSEVFQGMAFWVAENVPAGPERTVALRKLLEAKDAAVRGTVHPGG